MYVVELPGTICEYDPDGLSLFKYLPIDCIAISAIWSSLSDNPSFDVPKDFTRSRHLGFRRLSKTKQSKHFKAGVGFKPASDASRDATAQLNIKPAPGLNKYSGDAMISRQYDANRLGKPTTRNIKKGNIPEPKK